MVTVIDDLGNPVAGVTFTGDYDETHSEATEASGLATLRTDARVRNPGFGFCVDDSF